MVGLWRLNNGLWVFSVPFNAPVKHVVGREPSGDFIVADEDQSNGKTATFEG